MITPDIIESLTLIESTSGTFNEVFLNLQSILSAQTNNPDFVQELIAFVKSGPFPTIKAAFKSIKMINQGASTSNSHYEEKPISSWQISPMISEDEIELSVYSPQLVITILEELSSIAPNESFKQLLRKYEQPIDIDSVTECLKQFQHQDPDGFSQLITSVLDKNLVSTAMFFFEMFTRESLAFLITHVWNTQNRLTSKTQTFLEQLLSSIEEEQRELIEQNEDLLQQLYREAVKENLFWLVCYLGIYIDNDLVANVIIEANALDIHYAAQQGYLELSQCLIALESYPDTTDASEEKTALAYAKDATICQKLIQLKQFYSPTESPQKSLIDTPQPSPPSSTIGHKRERSTPSDVSPMKRPLTIIGQLVALLENNEFDKVRQFTEENNINLNAFATEIILNGEVAAAAQLKHAFNLKISEIKDPLGGNLLHALFKLPRTECKLTEEKIFEVAFWLAREGVDPNQRDLNLKGETAMNLATRRYPNIGWFLNYHYQKATQETISLPSYQSSSQFRFPAGVQSAKSPSVQNTSQLDIKGKGEAVNPPHPAFR